MPISVIQINKHRHKIWRDDEDGDTELWLISDSSNSLYGFTSYRNLTLPVGFAKEPNLHSIYTVGEINSKLKSEVADKVYTRDELYTKQEVAVIVDSLKSDYEEQILNLQNSLMGRIRDIETKLAENIAD